MTGVLFFIAGCIVVWHGFDVGGLAGFGYMALGVVGWLFALASWGMDAPPRYTSRRPGKPPGWKNTKRRG